MVYTYPHHGQIFISDNLLAVHFSKYNILRSDNGDSVRDHVALAHHVER